MFYNVYIVSIYEMFVKVFYYCRISLVGTYTDSHLLACVAKGCSLVYVPTKHCAESLVGTVYTPQPLQEGPLPQRLGGVYPREHPLALAKRGERDIHHPAECANTPPLQDLLESYSFISAF